MIAITVDKLVKRFGELTALNGVSLKIEPGELFFLLGPSGCGKTTLLRNLAGFHVPEQGRILFGQEDVTHLPPHKRNTGMMFQSYALFPHMTVAGNVGFGLVERKVPPAELTLRVKAALESVQMLEYAERKITQLSGGQQQRVALARALVIRPRCLLLDEPLSNLDAKLRLEMRTEIRRVCKDSGLTAIYVTHDQKEALSISDRMAIMNAGRVAQVGSSEEVYRRPQSKFVADFMGETDFITGKIRTRTDDRVTVETGLGFFEGIVATPDWHPAEGEEALVSIRPESWKLQPAGASINSVEGKIGQSVYLGEVGQYQFRTAWQELKIIELNPRPSARSPGHQLHAHVSPEDVVVIRPTSE